MTGISKLFLFPFFIYKKKKPVTIFCMILLLSGFSAFSVPIDWQKISSVRDVCAAYPEKMEYIFQNLNLDYPGLEKTKTAFESGELEKACELLLEYYHQPENNRLGKTAKPELSALNMAAADSILEDVYTFYLVKGKVPRQDDGHLKWDYKGPDDDIEWAWALNRHHTAAALLPFFYATGNPVYAKYIDQFIKDWITASWPYPAVKSNTAMWRGLEVSFREKVWAGVFYGLMNSGYLSPATQLLILSSLPDHAHYSRNFHGGGNWLTMEMSGLATVAAYWPEFKQSGEWLGYSVKTMTESLKEQVYPDGAQTELTSHYHYVALYNFRLFTEICEKAGKQLPLFYTETLEKMYNYLACTIRPDGFGLLNNDADRDNNTNMIMQAAEKFNRDDWKYIVSNGEKGVRPTDGPSYIFPWAGQLISRSGFDKQAQWSFFDIGPWGTGHQHSDKLHLSVALCGHDFLVDAGRFAYQGEVAKKFRQYATGSKGHNVILIDGKGQEPGPKLAGKPLSGSQYKITPDFDFARGSFNRFGDLKNVNHTRSLFYVRDNFWVVADKIETDQPREIEALWHWHPACTVKQLPGGIVSAGNEAGKLEIIPVGKTDWTVKMVKGQETPEIQGWYSREYNVYEPDDVSVYSGHIRSDTTFVWLLFPSCGTLPEVKASLVVRDKNKITMKVVNPEKGEWMVTVPLSDSGKAKMSFSPF